MKFNKKQKWLVALLVFSTLVWAYGMRFLLVDKETVHYHANFAIYIDGQRDPLESFTFYEEVAACSDDNANNPRSRVHLHDENPYTIHVHDSGATWGHFLANLGYTLGDDVLVNDDAIFADSDSRQLRFVLNGREISSVANKLIDNEDVLLIDYSDSNESTLLVRYSSIPKNANEYNQKDDPASCAGGDDEAFWPRLQRTFGF